MKLIFCGACHDIVKLYSEERFCRCGRSSGQYVTGVHAVYSGPAYPMGFAEKSFKSALEQVRDDPNPHCGARFEAFLIADNAPTFTRDRA